MCESWPRDLLLELGRLKKEEEDDENAVCRISIHEADGGC